MEQHPVPQNVTTFQFRLIGDMTLKQFGYLCAGGVLAIISYKLPLPFFFTWPLTTVFALLGVGFAFVPIEERPMDVWVFSFFKSIYSPTQYIWQKGHAPAAPAARHPVATTPPRASPLVQTQTVGQPSVAHIYAPALGIPETDAISTHTPISFMDQLFGFFTIHPKVIPIKSPQEVTPALKSVTGTRPPEPAPITQAATPPPIAIDNHKIQELEAAVAALHRQLSTKNVTGDRVIELQTQLTDMLREKTYTDDELIRLKRQIENAPSTKTPNDQEKDLVASVTNSTPTVRPFSSIDAGVRAGIPRFTSIPNVITGIIKDDKGEFLPAILITVTNADGIPMRALKTNKLGQLAASTPLPNGVYMIEIEDPRERFTFDRAQVTLNGSVVPALEIIAKSQKQVTRDKIAQDIFGKPPM